MHAMIGEYARAQGVQHFYGLGRLTRGAVQAFGAGARHFESLDVLVAALQATLPANAVVLVKGSRFMQMERVVNWLVAA